MSKISCKSQFRPVYRATIRFLDDAEIMHCNFDDDHRGHYILHQVCQQLHIVETSYFGLRFEDQDKQRHWLDLAKAVVRQVRNMDSILFSFRVKFYPPDPLRLREGITKFQVYQQLKRDLLHGRLYGNVNELALLVACVAQIELGNYDPETHKGNYVSQYKILLNQTHEIEEKAMEIHQTQLKGFTSQKAEDHFLKAASKLETYAIEPFQVKDQRGIALYLGVKHCGILTFQGQQRIHYFRWVDIHKLNYEGKMFIVHLLINERRHTIGFKCPTASNCRYVWKTAVEQMLFFTFCKTQRSTMLRGAPTFPWSSKIRHTGKSMKQIFEELNEYRREDENPIPVPCEESSFRRKVNSAPGTPTTPTHDFVEIRYSSLTHSYESSDLDSPDLENVAAALPLSSPYCPDNTLPLLETVSEDQECHARKNNAVDENDTHESATHTTTTTTTTSNTTTNHAKIKLKFPKSTLNRPQPLNNQKIVIGSEELVGHDIDNVVKQRIDTLDKSPKIVRSTALIIKTSKAPAKATRRETPNEMCSNINSKKIVGDVPDAGGKTNIQVRNVNGRDGTTYNSTMKMANGTLAQSSLVTRNGVGKPQNTSVGHDSEICDYYSRDSCDRSSSESQLPETSGTSYNHSETPVHKMQKLQNSKLCVQEHYTQHELRRADGKLQRRNVHIVKLFIPAFMLTVTMLFIVIVVVFETDTTFFDSLRKTPEMVVLKNLYYAPIKEFLRTKLGLF